jgi:L-iditol 2-dehydrogenase
MKAIRIEKPGVYGLVETPRPVPEPGWALVRVQASAVCATDLELIGGTIGKRYPIIPGHEWSGTVASVGRASDEAWVGRRVVGSNDIVCLTCKACRSGLWRNCASFREIGFKADGAYAEYLVVPVYALSVLPEAISFVQGALVEPLAVALGTLEKVDLRLGDTVVILGAGSIGLNLLAVAKAAGARRILVLALSERRFGFARKMGAHATLATGEPDVAVRIEALLGGSPDVVVDATGTEACVRLALSIAGKGARVALAGFGRGEDFRLPIDDLHVKNLHVFGAGNNWNLVDKALDLLQDGLVSTEILATHRFPLARFEEALEMTRTRPDGFVKSVFGF